MPPCYPGFYGPASLDAAVLTKDYMDDQLELGKAEAVPPPAGTLQEWAKLTSGLATNPGGQVFTGGWFPTRSICVIFNGKNDDPEEDAWAYVCEDDHVQVTQEGLSFNEQMWEAPLACGWPFSAA